MTYNIINMLNYTFSDKANINIYLQRINPKIEALTSDPSNKLFIKIEARNTSGYPVPMAHIKVKVDTGLGEVFPSSLRTDKNGESVITYIPPAKELVNLSKSGEQIKITASLCAKYSVTSSLKFKLLPPPVILVHGYQENPDVFDDLKSYLSSKGFQCSTLSYDSTKGVVKAAKALSNFLREQSLKYLSCGIQVQKFDIIAHSMGGLISRYYTCSKDYIENNDIRKVIFVSVPQRGSPWAPIGGAYFKDDGIKDLIPDNKLLSSTLPSMLNQGLNRSIQVGSILGQFDEVVSMESASLDEWGLKTEIFSVGDSNFNMNSILNGNIIEASNHRNILNNKKVFLRIIDMLKSELPYPIVK